MSEVRFGTIDVNLKYLVLLYFDGMSINARQDWPSISDDYVYFMIKNKTWPYAEYNPICVFDDETAFIRHGMKEWAFLHLDPDSIENFQRLLKRIVSQ